METVLQKCPICRARYAGKARCHRCKTDLVSLLNLLNQAESHFQRALAFRAQEDFSQMFYHAKRAYQLRHTEASRKLLATAALLNRKFDLAISLWSH